ncbi:MAG: UPF0058 family protein [Archaeoglobaceae archaeon]|nr:UPF0058 family protein [Archaeoglobaceae archaeon]MCX8151762.1 UPF0058 family protein [Archaeoglobaceae archaeon]MDW8014268.1 UPF0058 family protein [Archaeoglobaceae archaeon]
MSAQFGKEELVHLHLLLFQIKRAFEFAGIKNEFFYRYDIMGILPIQIFKQKNEHKEAILNLCLGILKAVGKDVEARELCKKIKLENS